jgi:glyoxylase-like metal-dependent hydrolase (beta-lactamase superfamily II)
MRKTVLLLSLLCAAGLSADDPRDVTRHYELVKVAEGVHAFISPEPRTGVVNGNVTVIIGGSGVVVVDSGQFPTLAAQQIADLRKMTDQPVRAIINTHWHWDHNLGNAVWRDAFPSAAIISTTFTRNFIVTYTPGFLEQMTGQGDKFIEQLRAQLASGKRRDGTELTAEQRTNLEHTLHDFEGGLPELRKVKMLPPDLTFDRVLTIHLGDREVRVVHPGRANTAGDAIVWVPDAKVLITGDLVVHPTPYATSAYPSDWIAAMEKLRSFPATAIVPGHGPVQRDWKYVDAVTDTLRFVVEHAAAAVRDGLSLDEAKKRIDLEPQRKKFAGEDPLRRKAFDDYFAEAVVTNAYRQAKGEPTDEAPFPVK